MPRSSKVNAPAQASDLHNRRVPAVQASTSGPRTDPRVLARPRRTRTSSTTAEYLRSRRVPAVRSPTRVYSHGPDVLGPPPQPPSTCGPGEYQRCAHRPACTRVDRTYSRGPGSIVDRGARHRVEDGRIGIESLVASVVRSVDRTGGVDLGVICGAARLCRRPGIPARSHQGVPRRADHRRCGDVAHRGRTTAVRAACSGFERGPGRGRRSPRYGPISTEAVACVSP